MILVQSIVLNLENKDAIVHFSFLSLIDCDWAKIWNDLQFNIENKSCLHPRLGKGASAVRERGVCLSA